MMYSCSAGPAPPRGLAKTVSENPCCQTRQRQYFWITTRPHVFSTAIIVGPSDVELLPNQPEPRFDEREIYKQTAPQFDWESIFNDMDRQCSSATIVS